MNNKMLVYTDLHSHNFNEFSYTLEQGITNRLMLSLKTLEMVLDYAVDNNIKYVYNLGDMFEYPNSINTRIASLFTDILMKPKYKDLIHILISGNHDTVDKKHKYTIGKVFRGCFTKLVDYSNYKDIEEFVGSQYKWVCVPYIEDDDVLNELIGKIPDKGNTVLLGHLALDGVKYNEYYKPKHLTKLKYLNEFKFVFMGHIHLHQMLSDTVMYPGGTLAHSYGDTEGFKGFIEYDLDTNKIKKIDNPYSPTFNTIEVINESSLLPLKSSNQDTDFYRIRVPFNQYYKYEEELEQYRNISIVPVPSENNKVNTGLAMSKDMTEKDILKQYVLDTNVGRPVSLLRYGNSLLNIYLASNPLKNSVIELDSILIENFMSIKKIFHNYIKSEPLVLVEGEVEGSSSTKSNGAGKTSLVEALTWCFYEKTIRSLDAKMGVEDVVNDKVNKNCLVEVTGRINGVKFMIRRTRNHKEFLTGVIVEFNEIDQKEEIRRKGDANSYVKELLGIDFDSFVSSLMFTGKSNKFSQMTKTQRAEVFEKFMGLKKYTDARALVRERIKKQSDIASRICSSEVTVTALQDKALMSLQEAKEKNEQYKNNISGETNKINAEIDEIENLLKGKKTIKELESVIFNLNKTKDNESQELKNQILTLDTEIKHLGLDIEDINNEILRLTKLSGINQNIISINRELTSCKSKEDLGKDLSKIMEDSLIETSLITEKRKALDTNIEENNSEIATINNSISSISAQLNSLDTADVCPTCNQKVDNTKVLELKGNYESQIKDLQDKLPELVKLKDSYILEKSTLDKAYTEIADKYRPKTDEINSIITRVNSLELRLKSSQDELVNNGGTLDVKDYEVKIKELADGKTKLSSDKSSKELLKEEINPKYLAISEKYNNLVLGINNTIAEIQSYNVKIDTLKERLVSLTNSTYQEMEDKYQKDFDELQVKVGRLNWHKVLVNKVIDRMKYWDIGYSIKGVKAFVVKSVLPYATGRAEQFSALLTNSEILVSFTLSDNGEINTNVFSVKGGNTYGKCSDGERRRADLIIQFALDDVRGLSNRFSLDKRFYDEVFDSVDSYGTDNILRTIKIINQDKTIYLISHAENLKDKVSKVITMKKSKDGFSTLEE